MTVWCIFTTEYYTAVKKNETMKFADKWIELEKFYGHPVPKRLIFPVFSFVCMSWSTNGIKETNNRTFLVIDTFSGGNSKIQVK